MARVSQEKINAHKRRWQSGARVAAVSGANFLYFGRRKLSQLNRFRLYGRRAVEFLSRCIETADELSKVQERPDGVGKVAEDVDWKAAYGNGANEWRTYAHLRFDFKHILTLMLNICRWNTICTDPTASNVNGELLPMLVVDPRAVRSQRKANKHEVTMLQMTEAS